MNDAPVVVLTADSTFLPDLPARSSGWRVMRAAWAEGEQALPADLIARQVQLTNALALCIGPDVPEDLALQVAALLDEHTAAIGVMLVRTPTAELWRRSAIAGIRDVVDPAATVDDVRISLLGLIDRAERQRANLVTSTPSARVIVVLSPKGGSGKTMVATNLAVALVSAGVGDVALVDLDCIFGDVASVLGMVPERTIGQLAAMGTVDSTTVKVFLTRHEESGLQVLAGSGLPEEGEAVTPAAIHDIMEPIIHDFRFVVVDTAAGLDERALAAIDLATDLVFVASLDVTSIKNLGKEIDALDRMGVTGARRHFILNRADARVGLEVADVERALGMSVDAALPSSRVVPLSMNQGQTLVLTDPDGPVSAEIARIARRLAPDEIGPAKLTEERRRGLFKRRTP
jgi:pilus assembly protein CpaE